MLDDAARFLQRAPVGSPLVAEAHGDRILEMGPSGLEDLRELRDPTGELRLHLRQFVQQGLHSPDRCNSHCRGVGIVAGLRAVDLVVWIKRIKLARGARKPGVDEHDRVVHVHVERGACPGLESIDRKKLVPVRRFPDSAHCREDSSGDLRLDRSKPPVCARRGLLDVEHRQDEPARNLAVRDALELEEGPCVTAFRVIQDVA